MPKTRASCFIRGSRHFETIKVLGLRPGAFVCFSVSGTPDETLALVFDILLENHNQMKTSGLLTVLHGKSFLSQCWFLSSICWYNCAHCCISCHFVWDFYKDDLECDNSAVSLLFPYYPQIEAK